MPANVRGQARSYNGTICLARQGSNGFGEVLHAVEGLLQGVALEVQDQIAYAQLAESVDVRCEK